MAEGFKIGLEKIRVKVYEEKLKKNFTILKVFELWFFLVLSHVISLIIKVSNFPALIR